MKDDDKLTLSICLNEFEANSCDLSELLNNLMQTVLVKMSNPTNKHKLLTFVKSLYIEPLIEANGSDSKPEVDTCDSLVDPLQAINSTEKLQLDLRLFEAMIQRYLIASRVFEADESMLFNASKPSCLPDDYYLPSSEAAIKLKSTTWRETNENDLHAVEDTYRPPTEGNLITLASGQTTTSNNISDLCRLNLSQQTGRHLSQNVTPLELPEIAIEGGRRSGGRLQMDRTRRRQQQQQPQRQQLEPHLVRRNLSWHESGHDNHDHQSGLGASAGACRRQLDLASGLGQTSFRPPDSNQLESIYVDDHDEHQDRHLRLLLANNEANNNKHLVSIKKQQDKNDKDYLLQPIQPRSAPPPDVPDMRGREQVNNNSNNNKLSSLYQSQLNDNNQPALHVAQWPLYNQQAPSSSSSSRYQNNCGGGGGPGGSSLVDLSRQPVEATISGHFNGLSDSSTSSTSPSSPAIRQAGRLTFGSLTLPVSNNNHVQNIEGADLSPFDHHHHHRSRRRRRRRHGQFASPATPANCPSEPIASLPGHLDRSWASLESLDRLAAYQLAGDNINSGYQLAGAFNQSNDPLYEPVVGRPDQFTWPAGQQQPRLRTNSMGSQDYYDGPPELAGPQAGLFRCQWNPLATGEEAAWSCPCAACRASSARSASSWAGAFPDLPVGGCDQGQQLCQQAPEQRCQSSMSMPNSANWNQPAWNLDHRHYDPRRHPFAGNISEHHQRNIPSTNSAEATMPAPPNWAPTRPSHLLSNQQVVGGPRTPANSEPTHDSHPHQHQQRGRLQPLWWSSASQLRPDEPRSQVKSQQHRRARHRRRHRQPNYLNEQQRPASDEQAHLHDYDYDQDDDDEDDGLPTCVSLVPSQAKGRLPMSVAEQMSEQANNFILQHGSSSGSCGSSSARSRKLGGSSTAAAATSGQPQKKPNLQVRRTLRVKIKKCKPILGIAIEGGFNVSGQLLPRIVCVHEEGAAYQCGKLRASDLILEINGISTVNMTHDDIARTIATAYYQDERPYIEFLIGESVHV